jgi:23S rRNA (uracil1939-C5)-methyltransferase
MPDSTMIPFKISTMDSLGQGVSKETDKITFISKVLPGETGEAKVTGQRKGVCFATLHQLKTPSPHRIEPSCPHFQNCPSCHYLHTSYEQELSFKQSALEKLFHKIAHPEVIVTPAIRRTHYRNRIQLHYNKAQKQLGMLDVKNHSIAPIPFCQIGRPMIAAQVEKLYQGDSWLPLVKHEANQGHIELYEQGHHVQVSVNRPYAEGGFTQVFEEMNQSLKELLEKWAQNLGNFQVLDLFGGNGNLSQNLKHSKRLCVDSYTAQTGVEFFSQDLYAADAIGKVKKKWSFDSGLNSLLILDPPRSGLKNLSEWLKEFHPRYVAYVSCDPHTLARDLAGVDNYHVNALHLIDFFPGTFHYETMVFLEQK